ncbi:hypothetical protein SAY87_024010 [Trapa incisa]|uniref:Uncharacterized protein n=1 Tax=Trapa incisa TaxID=236973 RepID=A0AAN7L1K2_9MYRT|nr:hypothetical protein SAY87_024010 [Trapa incisa]
MMGEPRSSNHDVYTDATPPVPPPPPPPPRRPVVSLVQPSKKKKHQRGKVVRVFPSVFRSFPIISPVCKLPSLPMGGLTDAHRAASGGSRVTGTLFGYRKGRVSLSVQESPRCLPTVVLELGMHMNALQKELGFGMVRIALECEKSMDKDKDKTKLMDCVLQWPEDRLRGQEGGQRGGPQRDGAPQGCLHGCRSAAGELQHGGPRQRAGLHEGLLRAGRRVKGLRYALYAQPRGQ